MLADGLDAFDFDSDLSDDIEAFVGAIGGPIIHLRNTRVHDRLGARDARLCSDEHDLARIIGSHFDESVRLRMDAAAGPLLIHLAIVVWEALRGPVVAEAVDLRHVFGRDDASNLESLACRAPRKGHREVHDQALQARSLDLPHECPPLSGSRGTLSPV